MYQSLSETAINFMLHLANQDVKKKYSENKSDYNDSYTNGIVVTTVDKNRV